MLVDWTTVVRQCMTKFWHVHVAQSRGDGLYALSSERERIDGEDQFSEVVWFEEVTVLIDGLHVVGAQSALRAQFPVLVSCGQ